MYSLLGALEEIDSPQEYVLRYNNNTVCSGANYTKKIIPICHGMVGVVVVVAALQIIK